MPVPGLVKHVQSLPHLTAALGADLPHGWVQGLAPGVFVQLSLWSGTIPQAGAGSPHSQPGQPLRLRAPVPATPTFS